MKLFWLVAALASIALFFPFSRRPVRHYLKSSWDARIPLVPLFVIAYLGLFPFVGVAFYALYFTPLALPFYVAMTVCALAAAFFWYYFPTGFRKPRHVGRGNLKFLMKELYHYHGHASAFPSSHVYLSVISGYFLALAFPPLAILIWMITVCIAISTVLIHQHELIDILGGLLWASASIISSFYFLGA